MIHAANGSAPDLILHNGTIHGQAGQSIAIQGGLIVAVADDGSVTNLAGRRTTSVNLEGRLVLPGFIDTHIHFHEWAMKRQELQLDGVAGMEELLEAVARQAGRLPGSEWILGQGWNESEWPEKRMPTRTELDRVAPDHPVLLWRCDLHLAVANSAALIRAAITGETPDPPRGSIERDDYGVPTGVLRELAINFVREAVDSPDPARVVDAYQGATHALYQLGITGIHDTRLMDDGDGHLALQTFYELDRTGRLGLRSWVTLPGDRLDGILELGLRSGFGNERLRLGHVKFFSDGGVGARTAWMSEPYTDTDCTDAGCGMPLMDMTTLAAEIEKADRSGLSVMVHAIGDRAVSEVIGIFEHLKRGTRPADSVTPAYPHRIEHLQTIRPEDLARLRSLPLALGVTPANLPLDINLIDTALGERGELAYSFRHLVDTGLPVMLSSDCPVCNPDPLVGIHAAVTRTRADGTPAGGWYPHSRITTGEAVAGYTSIPASVHSAGDIGSLEQGKWADIAVFSHDFLNGPEFGILDTCVDMTLFDGRIVYRNF